MDLILRNQVHCRTVRRKLESFIVHGFNIFIVPLGLLKIFGVNKVSTI